jgi:transcriptional regulator with XRE-family HTH domain
METPEQTIRREAIVRIRKRLRVTQLDVSQATGVGRSILSLWENGYTGLDEATIDSIVEFLSQERRRLLDPGLAAALTAPQGTAQEVAK